MEDPIIWPNDELVLKQSNFRQTLHPFHLSGQIKHYMTEMAGTWNVSERNSHAKEVPVVCYTPNLIVHMAFFGIFCFQHRVPVSNILQSLQKKLFSSANQLEYVVITIISKTSALYLYIYIRYYYSKTANIASQLEFLSRR